MRRQNFNLKFRLEIQVASLSLHSSQLKGYSNRLSQTNSRQAKANSPNRTTSRQPSSSLLQLQTCLQTNSQLPSSIHLNLLSNHRLNSAKTFKSPRPNNSHLLWPRSPKNLSKQCFKSKKTTPKCSGPTTLTRKRRLQRSIGSTH